MFLCYPILKITFDFDLKMDILLYDMLNLGMILLKSYALKRQQSQVMPKALPCFYLIFQ